VGLITKSIKQYDQRDSSKGSGTIIGILMDRLKYERVLKDKVGVFALVTKNTVVVGKSYVFKDIVSCHVRAVYAAHNTGRSLVMYVKNDDTFYRFDPQKIVEDNDSWINHKGTAKMFNFPIAWGDRLPAALDNEE